MSKRRVADHRELGRAWEDTGLVFTTRTGRPIEPRNLLRSFRRICGHNQLRLIKVHHLWHPTATLLKPRRPGPRRAADPRPLTPGRDAGDLLP